MKSKRKSLIKIMINILLLQNLISLQAFFFNLRLTQAGLISQIDIANFVIKTDFDNQVKKCYFK